MNLNNLQSSQPNLRSWMPIAVGTALLAVSCLLGPNFALSPLHAQDSNPRDHIPAGWLLAGDQPANYRAGTDKAVIREGRPSAYLHSAVTDTGGFGTLMQSIDSSRFAGKRVRLRAWVKSQDVRQWAGMWMRVDKQQAVVAFDNMQDRPITGTQSWGMHDVVLDVPADATSISFGVLLSGAGQVWMNHVTFEEVGEDTPVTRVPPSRNLTIVPVNLDFSE
jgi:hypothetical protein